MNLKSSVLYDLITNKWLFYIKKVICVYVKYKKSHTYFIFQREFTTHNSSTTLTLLHFSGEQTHSKHLKLLLPPCNFQAFQFPSWKTHNTSRASEAYRDAERSNFRIFRRHANRSKRGEQNESVAKFHFSCHVRTFSIRQRYYVVVNLRIFEKLPRQFYGRFLYVENVGWLISDFSDLIGFFSHLLVVSGRWYVIFFSRIEIEVWMFARIFTCKRWLT